MKLKTFFSKRVFFSIVVVSFVFTGVFNGIRSCCASNSYDKFEEAMEEGNLSEAKTILKEGNIDNDAALQLIKAYLDTGNSDAAIDVYENIISNHTSRYEMQFTNLNMSKKLVKCFVNILCNTDSIKKHGTIIL